MATLEKIRSKAGLLVLVVGFALFAFIIGDFLNSGSAFFRQSQEQLAKVDGQVIKIQDYQAKVDEMTEMYKMQSGQTSLPDQYMTQIRQSVYNNMIQEIVLDEATEKLGLTVSAEELFDMVQGNNISPMLQQMRMFQNPQTKQFDKTQLLNFLKAIEVKNISNYPQAQQAELKKAKAFWLFWENSIKRQRLEQKYTTLLAKAISANKLDAKDTYDATIKNADIEYAMQNYASIPDSTIEVSDSEIRDLYNQRKENYKRAEGRILKYIAVDIRPSQTDYDKAQKEMDDIKDELASSDKIADIVNETSDVPYVDAFVAPKNFDAEMKKFVEASDKGAIYGPAFENDNYRIFKLIDKTTAPDSVKVSHIMLTGQDQKAVDARADSLMNVLKHGGNFEELAKEFSADQSKDNGGEIGWFTETTALRGLNEDFKDAIFNANKNDVVKVKSTYGTHLVKVTDRTKSIEKYKIADIERSVSPSSKTYSDTYNKLNQFLSKNTDPEKMEEAAKKDGYNVRTNVTISSTDEILGSVKKARQVVRWAFQHDKNEYSEIFECGEEFVVAVVTAELPQGYRSINEVASSLRHEIAAQKKGEKIATDLKAKNLTSIEAYATAMNTKVDSVKFVNFGTRRIAGIGVEPNLNAMVSLTPVNQLSQPVIGNNGVYVIKKLKEIEDTKSFNYEKEAKDINANTAYRINYLATRTLINNADIEDNRIRFY